MIKYFFACILLKVFSSNSLTIKAYKKLTETYGQRRKINLGLTNNHINQFALISNISDDKNIINNGDKILEIGTGWTPWLATMITFFKDAEVYLVDIIDNRRLPLYKSYINSFKEKIINNKIQLKSEKEKGKICSILSDLSEMKKWNDIYEYLNFTYILSPSGSFEVFENESFNLLISWDVLEHIKPNSIEYLTNNFYRILKPNSFSIHQIDYSDHYYYYDKTVSIKQYLKYSDRIWHTFFQNEVQYFNRLQSSDWIKHFHKCNFKLIKEESIESREKNIFPVNKKYIKYSKKVLQSLSSTMYHIK